MKVIDQNPYAWFFFGDGNKLFLDVNCNHSAFGYSWMIEMNDYERESYRTNGRKFLDQLAQNIQFSAPALKDSTSPYKNRDVSKKYSDATSEAVRRWKEE